MLVFLVKRKQLTCSKMEWKCAGLARKHHEDIQRAFNVYGQPIESVRGKMMQRVVKHIHFDPTMKSNEKSKFSIVMPCTSIPRRS